MSPTKASWLGARFLTHLGDIALVAKHRFYDCCLGATPTDAT